MLQCPLILSAFMRGRLRRNIFPTNIFGPYNPFPRSLCVYVMLHRNGPLSAVTPFLNGLRNMINLWSRSASSTCHQHDMCFYRSYEPGEGCPRAEHSAIQSPSHSSGVPGTQAGNARSSASVLNVLRLRLVPCASHLQPSAVEVLGFAV